MPSRPAHVRIAALPEYAFQEHRFRFVLSTAETGGSYSLMEVVSPQGSGPGPHVHAEAEEHFQVLDGEVDFSVDGVRMRARAGDVVHIPRGLVHDFTVTTPSATMMATFSPGGDEQGLLEQSVPGLSE